MSNFQFSREDLLRERSLWDVYRIARLTPANGLNVVVALLMFFVCVTYCISPTITSSAVLVLLRSISSDALAFSASILGFLVAGFTIFVTSKSEIFFLMAKTEQKPTGVSYLKYNLSVFLLVFIHYLAFTIFCVTIRLLCAPQGPASIILSAMPLGYEDSLHLKAGGIYGFFCVFATWFLYLLMLLKSFIFNVYHIVMTGIAITIDDEEEGVDEKDAPSR